MGNRKPIQKSVRFEVFKRDSFRCQYCGRSAPDVVLHIDHIKPVAKGGGNDIMNLVTSCFDCNSGKGAREISDRSVIAKQRHQLEELNERREQLEAMLEWREELSLIRIRQLEYAISEFENTTDKSLSEYGQKKLQIMIAQFGFSEVLTAIEILGMRQVKPGGEISYMAGICWKRKRSMDAGEKP